MAELSEILKLIEVEIPEGKELKDIEISEIEDGFKKKFIGKNIAHEVDDVKSKILGREWGSYETAFKRLARELEVDGLEITGKKDDVDKITEALKGKIEGIKENSTAGKDKQVKELEDSLTKYKNDYKTLLEQKEASDVLVESTKKEFSDYKTNLSLNQKIDGAKSGIVFSDTVNDFTKKGFFVELGEKYKIELSTEQDSDDGLRITDKNGNRIMSGSKFTTLKELYEKEAKDADLLKLGAAKPKEKVVVQPPKGGTEDQKKTNPMAEEFAQQLKDSVRDK